MTPLSLPEPNIPLLRKAVEWAETEAAKTDGTGLWNQAQYRVETECGTAYCIAGWVAANSPDVEIVNDCGYTYPVLDGQPVLWGEAGERLLGLGIHEGGRLFDGDNSIEDVRYYAELIAARAGERL